MGSKQKTETPSRTLKRPSPASTFSEEEESTESEAPSPPPRKTAAKKAAAGAKPVEHDSSESYDETSTSSRSGGRQASAGDAKRSNIKAVADGSGKPSAPPSGSSSEASSESETESEPELEPELEPEPKPELHVKHSKSSAAAPAPETTLKPASVGSKRAGAEPAAHEAQQPAKKPRAPTPVPEKLREDEEVVILTGVLSYIKAGMDPFTDMEGFYKSIKEDLYSDRRMDHVAQVLKRLKRRYQCQAGNAKKGKELHFTQGQKKTVFELSKKIWGGKGDAKLPDREPHGKKMSAEGHVAELETKVEKLEKKKPADLSNDCLVHDSLYSSLNWLTGADNESMNLELLRRGLDLMGPSKVRSFEQEWKKIQIAKIEIRATEAEFVKKQLLEILGALKGSDC